nr:reverse transcriptase domain-containing protein [Tanacetum cinerariifolium]
MDNRANTTTGEDRRRRTLHCGLDELRGCKPADMTGVPRHIAKHCLNILDDFPLIRKKKRGQAADRNQAIHKEVGKLVEARIMKEVHYHDWLSNPVMEDEVRQLTIINLAVEFENASIAKDDMQKSYEECNDIPEEKRALIDIYLKEEFDKDYEMYNALFIKATKLEIQINNKLAYGDDSFVTRDIVYITLFVNILISSTLFTRQWRDSYDNGDYDEDPYDDDMYGHDLPREIQAICDNLNIRVRGRKKK